MVSCEIIKSVLDNRMNYISTHLATSLSSGLLWPWLISDQQHIRLPCTFMTAGTKQRSWESRCGPEHSQRSWDQQLRRCKNKYSSLCSVLGHWQGRGERRKEMRGEGKEREGKERRLERKEKAKWRGEGEGGSQMDAVHFFKPSAFLSLFLFLVGT